uniref:Uncharacterized protein n=1 Tax=Picea glauca TaxID=3330 RepID=A0A117NG65_PICGL|nr:hypothetical protein ABT39_MTgene1831 [Picea glauca]QHR91810.1 hypothetical protein Q903MT_gene5846 [Picea sitchensis]
MKHSTQLLIPPNPDSSQPSNRAGYHGDGLLITAPDYMKLLRMGTETLTLL